jgi:hypothetical protein
MAALIGLCFYKRNHAILPFLQNETSPFALSCFSSTNLVKIHLVDGLVDGD